MRRRVKRLLEKRCLCKAHSLGISLCKLVVLFLRIVKETKYKEKKLRRGDMLSLTYAGSTELKTQKMALKKDF